MTAEADIAAIADGGENTAADVRQALTSVLGRADAGGGGEQVLPFHRSGELSVSSGQSMFPAPFGMTLLGVRAAVGEAPTGDDILLDVNLNGSTIFTTQSNRPTIADGNQSSPEATPDVSAVEEGDLLSVDVDQVGSTTAGSHLVLVIRFQTAE